MNKDLDVFLHAELVGTLRLDSADEMVFQYNQNAPRPISVGMPVAQKHFEAPSH